MKAEARANVATDKADREMVEKLNMADSLVFQTEKQLKEYGEKIPQDKKTIIENAAEQLKEAHKNQDIPAIDSAMQSLNAAWTAASEDIYKSQAEQPGADGNAAADGNQQAGGQQTAGANADNVTDVPYEEVK
jgi:molecular chaperone DnaK